MKATESTVAVAAENIMTDGVEPLADLDATDERGVSADLVRAYLNGIGRTRLLTAVEEVTLSKRIEAGLYADEKLPTAGDDLAPLLQIIIAEGARRQEPPARGQPAAGGQHREALHRPRHGVPGPDPGRQPRPDPRRREVRLHQGLQVLHLRHLVDPPGHHPRHGRPGPHHPHPGAHGRAGQPHGPGPPRPRRHARPRAERRRDRQGHGRPGVPGHRADLLRPRAGQPRPGRRRGRRERPRRLRRRGRPPRRARRQRRRRASCAARSRSCSPPSPSASRR